jgi:hypothetical protein
MDWVTLGRSSCTAVAGGACKDALVVGTEVACRSSVHLHLHNGPIQRGKVGAVAAPAVAPSSQYATADADKCCQ